MNAKQREYRKTPKGREGAAAAYRKWSVTEHGKEVRRGHARAWRESPFGRAGSLLSDARRRRAVFVSREWVQTRLEAGVCEVTGIPFDFSPRRDGGHLNPLAPSLDRKDPAGDYTEDNTQVVLLAYNTAKGQLADSDARALLKRIGASL